MKVFRLRRETLVFLAFAAGFLLLKLINLSPRASDENWYFYAAKLFTDGVVPYRDFFIAHPPGQFLLYSVLIKMIGFNLYVLRFMAPVFGMGSAFVLYRLLVEKKREDAAILASLFFLFSFVVLGATDFSLGVHEATFFLVLSWYLLQRSAILGGLSLFVGLTFRLYILPAALGFLAFEFIKKNYRKVLKYAIFAVVPFVLVNLALLFLFGEKFFTPVWRYHFLKLNLSFVADEFPLFIRNDVLLLLFSVGGVWLMLRKVMSGRRTWKSALARQPAIIDLGISATVAVIMQLVFLQGLSRIFHFYFLTLMPFLSVIASLSLSFFLPLRSRKLALPLVVAISIFNSFFYQKEQAKLATLESLDEIVSDIKSITNNNDTIFGAYIITPLLAAKTDLAITENQVDTNFQRYMTGLFPADEATRLATKSAVFIQKAVVDYDTGEVLQLAPSYVDRKALLSSCILFKDYSAKHGYGFNAIVLWDCRNKTE
jgi:hypothetical protein